MRLLFALPGFHRYDRGAEIALLSVASKLAESGDEVTVVGSGEARAGTPYSYRRIPSIRRENFEHFPRLPMFRNETAWEDATFAIALRTRVELSQFDATLTCSFPHTHWALRKRGSGGPAHFFVTQNGDWPARSEASEYRFFGCDGLICTNPDYFAANREQWSCALIPNGVDSQRFNRGPGNRHKFGLPDDRPIILMVSALIESKRVDDAIRIVGQMDDAFLVVAGDGPLRREIDQLADRHLPGRFKRLTLPADDMPFLYRSSDAFLHMSRTESFGNIYLEAMASGLPIVAHESESLRWIVGDGEYLCDTDREEAVMAQLQAAIDGPSACQTSRLERFAWGTIAGEYREFIAKTLATRSDCQRAPTLQAGSARAQSPAP